MMQMKKILVLLLLLTSIIFSCENETIEQRILLVGAYKGTFSRTSRIADWMSANVTLEFEGNSFSGESDKEKYPAICKGKYKVNGNEINFENQCPWTAEFDWTFILNGKFEIEQTGKELVITRKYDEHTFDQYILTKQ